MIHASNKWIALKKKKGKFLFWRTAANKAEIFEENKLALEKGGLSVLHCDWSAGLIDGCAAGFCRTALEWRCGRRDGLFCLTCASSTIEVSRVSLFIKTHFITTPCVWFSCLCVRINLWTLSVDSCCNVIQWHIYAAICGFYAVYFSNRSTVRLLNGWFLLWWAILYVF